MLYRTLICLLALFTFGCVTAEDVKKADAFRELGLTYLHEGNTPDALRMLMEARELNPKNAHIHHELGLAYFSREMHAEAEACFIEAIRLQPDLSEARMNLGTLYIATGRFEEAAVLLEQVATDPLYHRPYRAFNNLGIVYSELGRNEDAITAYRQSLKLAPGFCQAHFNLAAVLQDEGRYPQADKHIQEAANRCPEDGRFQLEYAAYLVREERGAEAIPILNAISMADPMGDLGERARELLQVLQ